MARSARTAARAAALAAAIAAVLGAAAPAPVRAVDPPPAGEPLNEFEWIGPAPIVVVAASRGRNGKVEEFLVERVVRGELPAETVIGVRVRRANRWRSEHSPHDRLQVEPGRRYVLLLAPAEGRGEAIRYDLTRGVRGARELPREGAPAVVQALERFAEIQDRQDHDHTWREMRAMLEEDHPLLLQTALEQYVKFRRGDAELIPTLRPLMDHPRPRFRALATQLVATILEREEYGAVPDPAPLRGELIALARRDPDSGVRVMATRALDRFPGEAVENVLEQIARDDPDQEVRYAAERLLWERRQRRDAGGADPARASRTGPGAGPD